MSIAIALCGVPQPAVDRIRQWMEQHESMELTIAYGVTDPGALLEQLPLEPVHGVILHAGLGMEGLSFAQELLAAGYQAVCLAGTAERLHLRQRAAEVGLACCPDLEPARLASLLRSLLGLSTTAAADGQVIACHSPRGGAGTSTLLLHLAQSLHGRGRNVAIVEVGGYGSAIPLLGLRPGPGWEMLLPELRAGLAGRPNGPEVLARALVEVLPGLHLLPSGGPTVMDQVGPEDVDAVLHLLPACGFSYILIDTASDLTLPTASALASAHAICLIALPDPVSAFRLAQTQEALAGLQIPLDRIIPVVNRTRETVPQRLTEVLEFLRLRPAVRVPEESKPPVDAGTGRFSGFRAGSGAAKSLDALLEHLTMEVSPT